MRAATQQLKDLLASRQFLMADLFTFSLVGGTALRYTTWDSDLVSGGHPFSSALRLERSRVSWKIGVEVAKLDVQVYPRASDLIGGVPWLDALRRGLLDGAEVTLERAFMPTSAPGDTSAGTVTLFGGRVAEVEAGRTSATIHVNSHVELLNIKLPRDIYQPSCLNSLFDAGCNLSKGSWQVSATVGFGATTAHIPCGATQATGWFDLGTVAFTSGPCAGSTRTVKRWSGGVLRLIVPLPQAPAQGDGLTLAPGCDKLLATCTGKFNNKARFRGTPFVPVPETAF